MPKACPLCENTKTEQIRTGIREDPDRPVYRCANCALQFLDPPTGELRAYYAGRYREQHSLEPGRVLSPEQDFEAAKPLIDQRVARFRDEVPKGAIVLDVGCGSGAFLDAIRKDYTVHGTDWNPCFAGFVRDKLGIPCDEQDVGDAFPGKSFTAITGFHVLEHVPAPLQWLGTLRDRLIGGGWIMLETPNTDNALLALYDLPEFRDFWYREPHLSMFNMMNLGYALGTVGFEARVTLRQTYSFANMMSWYYTRRPQATPREAQFALVPTPREHPAQNVANRFFMSVDRQYRNLMDSLKSADTLVALGRKREI